MSNSTTNTYQMKRDILNYSKKISKGCTRNRQKFSADMIYGLLAAKSCVLSEIAHELQEPIVGGTAAVTVRVLDKAGWEILTETETVQSRDTLWGRVAAFLRRLFRIKYKEVQN